MGLIDSHAHLTFPQLRDQVNEVVVRCAEAGVERIITVGTDLADSRQAMELLLRYPERINVAAGFHPHEAEKVAEADFDAMARLWDHAGVLALGEMGLDYHYDFADRALQRSVFARQLELASGRDKPIVIHCREALGDAIPLLIDHGYEHSRVVFHCFSGTAEEASRIAEHGWRISFTGMVTFHRSDRLQEIARSYPADQLMIETDSPYLAPEPVRGRRPNEPAYLAHTARFLADLRGVSYEEFVGQTSRSTRTFFGM